jgi:hypothetical protein
MYLDSVHRNRGKVSASAAPPPQTEVLKAESAVSGNARRKLGDR